MPIIYAPQPEYMEDEEISMFQDAIGKFLTSMRRIRRNYSSAMCPCQRTMSSAGRRGLGGAEGKGFYPLKGELEVTTA